MQAGPSTIPRGMGRSPSIRSTSIAARYMCTSMVGSDCVHSSQAAPPSVTGTGHPCEGATGRSPLRHTVLECFPSWGFILYHIYMEAGNVPARQRRASREGSLIVSKVACAIGGLGHSNTASLHSRSIVPTQGSRAIHGSGAVLHRM